MTEDRPTGESQCEGSTPDKGAPRARRPEPRAQSPEPRAQSHSQPQPQPEPGPGSPAGGLDDDWDQEASLAATVAEIEAAYASGLIIPDELDEDDGFLPPDDDDDDWGGDDWGGGSPSGDGPIEEPAVAADGTGRRRLDVDPVPGSPPRPEGGPVSPVSPGGTGAGDTGECAGAGVPGRGVPAPRPGDRWLPARADQSARPGHPDRILARTDRFAQPEQSVQPDHAAQPGHVSAYGPMCRARYGQTCRGRGALAGNAA